ncbi:GNAT family N-acetyltransferase [Frigoribacterium salinisoli]
MHERRDDLPGPVLTTTRLLLRRWRDADRGPFAALNADPVVMEHFPATLTQERSDAAVEHIEAAFERDGWGLWAVERRDDGVLLGFTGLSRPGQLPHLEGQVEIGWRLAAHAWGQGYATEAAREVLRFAFAPDGADLDAVVSFTAATNERSQALMRRLGMTRDPADDFVHPALPIGSPLRPHVLYRLYRRAAPDGP